MVKRCKHCGVFIESPQKKYCVTCAPVVDKLRNRLRARRYRERHGNQRVMTWCKQHPEAKRLYARNYHYRHPERHKQQVREWRRKNPEKVCEQNKRAKKRRRLFQQKRRYQERNKEKQKTGQERFNRLHPTYQYDYYRNNHEVLAGMTCRVCGALIIYRGIGRVPQKCGLCKCIERSRPRPLYNPEDTMDFIRLERKRTGLDSWKKWTRDEIQALHRRKKHNIKDRLFNDDSPI